MNDHTPTEHKSHRRRRVRLTLASAIILAIAMLVNAAAPKNPAANTSRTAGTTTAGNEVGESSAGPSPAGDSSGVVAGATSAVLDAQPGLVRVVRDIDGDTIVVSLAGHDETVRFIGMDTPETHDPRKPVQCYGPEAAAHTKALLEGASVRLAADPEDSDRDKYGRLLRYIYLPDGTLVNAELVQDGYAFAYTIFPFSKIDDFRALQADAKASNRGLWAACNVNSSTDILQTAGAK